MGIPQRFLNRAALPPAIYIDREGDKITQQKWTELRKDRAYCVLKEFENNTHIVTATWLGEIRDPDVIEELWTPYSLSVLEIGQSGRAIRDENASGLPYSGLRTSNRSSESREIYRDRHVASGSLGPAESPKRYPLRSGARTSEGLGNHA